MQPNFTYLGRHGGRVVKITASQLVGTGFDSQSQKVLGSTPGTTCVEFACSQPWPRGFPPGTPVSPTIKNMQNECV